MICRYKQCIKKLIKHQKRFCCYDHWVLELRRRAELKKSCSFETTTSLLALETMEEYEKSHPHLFRKLQLNLTKWERGIIHIWKMCVEVRITELNKRGYFKLSRKADYEV